MSPRPSASIVEGSRPPLDALVEHFEASPTLLVLDNLEQVVDVALELDELLTAAPTLQILATSRTVLRLRAEREYPVAALAVPAPADSVDLDERRRVLRRPAVRRARRRPFATTSPSRRPTRPRSSRSAGASTACPSRSSWRPPARGCSIRLSLLDRLEHVLDALGSGPVDLPERQRTLRATVEWSIGLLDEDERRMLTTLAVFVDGWTLAAAVHVTGLSDDRTLDLLDALAGHSLVSIIASGAEPRFRMLVTVRELAAEHLAVDPGRDEVARRHAEHFASLVDGGDAPTESQAAWAARLRADEENLRTAIRWYFDHDTIPLPHLLRRLWLFWQMGDRMSEGRAWIEELRPRVDEGDLHARAEVLFTAAVTAVEVGDDEIALALLDEAAPLAGHVDDPQLESSLQLAIAWALPIVEDFEGAGRGGSGRARRLPAPERPVRRVRRPDRRHAGDDRGRRRRGPRPSRRGRRARPAVRQQLAAVRARRTQLATLAVRAGDLEQARRLLASSVDASTRAPLSSLTLTFTLVAFAQLALAEGRPVDAATALGAADGLRRRAGLRVWPLARQAETELTGRVVAAVDPDRYRTAFAAGSELHAREALGLL